MNHGASDASKPDAGTKNPFEQSSRIRYQRAMTPVERSSDSGPWGDILAEAKSADSDLAQYLSEKVQRSLVWLSLTVLIGLVAVIAIWMVDNLTTSILPGIGAGLSIAGVVHGHGGVRKSRLASKVAGHISKSGTSVKLMRRYQLMYRIFQLSCLGLLAGFAGRMVFIGAHTG